MRQSQGFLGAGENAFISGEREQMPNFEGNRGIKTILWNREHKKQIFDFWGTGEQTNLFQGNKGTGTPNGRASFVLSNTGQKSFHEIGITTKAHQPVCSEEL